MSPAEQVHVSVVMHRHGENIYVNRTAAGAVAALAVYARENWHELEGQGAEPPEALSDDQIVQAYFDENEDESYSTELMPVDD